MSDVSIGYCPKPRLYGVLETLIMQHPEWFLIAAVEPRHGRYSAFLDLCRSTTLGAATTIEYQFTLVHAPAHACSAQCRPGALT